jgi:Abortive infection alpha
MEGSELKDITEGAVKGAIEATPIYKDALQPAAQELGKGLLTVAKCINVALAPIKVLVWSYERVEGYLYEKLAKKLENVAPDQIITPPPMIAAPVVQALMLVAGEPTLSELYANLLATSMDSSTAEDAHPGFVEIIKQMSSDEAKIFKIFENSRAFPCIRVNVRDADGKGFVQNLLPHFSIIGEEAECAYPDKTDIYVDNLQRLGLVRIQFDTSLSDQSLYRPLEEHKTIQKLHELVQSKSDAGIIFDHGFIEITAFGIEFYNACVASKDEGPERIAIVPEHILNFTDY